MRAKALLLCLFCQESQHDLTCFESPASFGEEAFVDSPQVFKHVSASLQGRCVSPCLAGSKCFTQCICQQTCLPAPSALVPAFAAKLWLPRPRFNSRFHLHQPQSDVVDARQGIVWLSARHIAYHAKWDGLEQGAAPSLEAGADVTVSSNVAVLRRCGDVPLRGNFRVDWQGVSVGRECLDAQKPSQASFVGSVCRGPGLSMTSTKS